MTTRSKKKKKTAFETGPCVVGKKSSLFTLSAEGLSLSFTSEEYIILPPLTKVVKSRDWGEENRKVYLIAVLMRAVRKKQRASVTLKDTTKNTKRTHIKKQ